MLEINKVYNCDCIDLMRAMKQQGIVADWLIADPPYGINIGHTGFYKAVPTKKHGAAKAMQRNYVGLAEWDNARLSKEYFDLMFEVSKEQIIFGGNYYTDILPQTKSWIVWDKRCGNTRNNFADCELAWFCPRAGLAVLVKKFVYCFFDCFHCSRVFFLSSLYFFFGIFGSCQLPFCPFVTRFELLAGITGALPFVPFRIMAAI